MNFAWLSYVSPNVEKLAAGFPHFPAYGNSSSFSADPSCVSLMERWLRGSVHLNFSAELCLACVSGVPVTP